MQSPVMFLQSLKFLVESVAAGLAPRGIAGNWEQHIKQPFQPCIGFSGSFAWFVPVFHRSLGKSMDWLVAVCMCHVLFVSNKLVQKWGYLQIAQQKCTVSSSRRQRCIHLSQHERICFSLSSWAWHIGPFFHVSLSIQLIGSESPARWNTIHTKKTPAWWLCSKSKVFLLAFATYKSWLKQDT